MRIILILIRADKNSSCLDSGVAFEQHLKLIKCELFLFFPRKRYTIMDLAHGFDDIIASIKTVITVKDLHVTALIIELEYVYLIFVNYKVYVVCGKVY